jgi:hypothetical protein
VLRSATVEEFLDSMVDFLSNTLLLADVTYPLNHLIGYILTNEQSQAEIGLSYISTGAVIASVLHSS